MNAQDAMYDKEYADIIVHGKFPDTIYRFEGVTEEGKRFVAEEMETTDWNIIGNTKACEHRFVGDIIFGAIHDHGLEVWSAAWNKMYLLTADGDVVVLPDKN